MLKKIILLSSFVFYSTILAQQFPSVDHMVIEGSADTIVEANRASFNFDVVGYGSDLKEAIENSKKITAEVIKILADFEVTSSDLRTSLFNSGENPLGSSFLSSSEDFRSVSSTTVTVNNLNKLEDIIVKLSKSGIDKISNIRFSLQNYKDYEDKVRLLAIRNAKKKAEQFAKELSFNLKKVIYIDESVYKLQQSYPNPFNVSTPRDLSSSIDVRTMNNAIKLSDKVKVIYEIE